MTSIRSVDTTVLRLAPHGRCEQCNHWFGLGDPHAEARRHTAATEHETIVDTVVSRSYSVRR